MKTPTDGVIRLTLFTADDAPAMRDADGDPEHRKRFDFPSTFVPSIECSLAVVERWRAEREAATRFTYAVRDALTNELVGGCELRPLGSGATNVWYWTYPRHRRCGFAARAVRLLIGVAREHGHQTLEALIDPDNLSSLAVARANGFTRHGERDGRVLFVLTL